MEYVIIKLKKDYVMCDLNMIDVEVKAGARVLVSIDENGCKCCIVFREMLKAELDENIEGNECFEFLETVTTRKGTTVDIYRDMETLDTFFNVRRDYATDVYEMMKSQQEYEDLYPARPTEV